MSFKKDFLLRETWDEATASRLEILLNRLAKRALHAHQDAYTGDGLASKTIPIPEMGNPPVAIALQNPAGVSVVIVVPRTTNGIISWNQFGFTVAPAWNVNGTLYDFVVIS